MNTIFVTAAVTQMIHIVIFWHHKFVTGPQPLGIQAQRFVSGTVSGLNGHWLLKRPPRLPNHQFKLSSVTST